MCAGQSLIEAKNNLSAVIDRARAGEEIIITRHAPRRHPQANHAKTASHDDDRSPMARPPPAQVRHRGPDVVELRRAIVPNRPTISPAALKPPSVPVASPASPIFPLLACVRRVPMNGLRNIVGPEHRLDR
ncbi:type II toxin-antitoxin system Phd/YefM family antitoxin [Acidiphilium sp. PA]|uniref:type II toxin-antitoxin system Phd/YefM family antitoxin n=1 Tax=Acidiphilium sp. PA TaxID=2871705 RepID=UPI0038CF6400